MLSRWVSKSVSLWLGEEGQHEAVDALLPLPQQTPILQPGIFPKGKDGINDALPWAIRDAMAGFSVIYYK